MSTHQVLHIFNFVFFPFAFHLKLKHFLIMAVLERTRVGNSSHLYLLIFTTITTYNLPSLALLFRNQYAPH